MAGTDSLIRTFYDRVWNAWDEGAARTILSPALSFRGSLGDAVTGHDGFLAYQAKIRAAFPDFHNEIEDLIVDGGRAAARLRYTGAHTGGADAGVLFGIEPTGNRIDYRGAAFFTVSQAQIASVFVLGDVDTLKKQLGAA